MRCLQQEKALLLKENRINGGAVLKFGNLLKLAAQLFRSKLFGNIIVILELVSVCVFSVLIDNAAAISEKPCKIIEDSPYSTLYYKLPMSLTENFTSTNSESNSFYETAFLDKLDTYISEHDFVKGYLQYIISETALSADFSTGARVQLLNEIGIEALNFNVSDGVWLNDADPEAEYIPVVIGGKNAGNYYVGQKIVTYYVVNENADASGLPKNIYDIPYKEYKLQIVGKLAYPELSPFSATTVIGDSYPIGYMFSNAGLNDLFMFIPYDRYLDAVLSEDGQYLIFYDKNADSEQVSELQEFIGNGYSWKTEQMIADQRKETEENLSASMPFMHLAAAIILVGVLSTCILTTVSNMNVFRIYFLCGMSKKQCLAVILFFTVIFFTASAAVFGLTILIIMNCGLDASVTAYLIPQQRSVFFILSAMFAVVLASSIIPALIVRNTNIVNLIRNYGKE